MLQCFSLETPSWLLPVATICTQTAQDIKVAIIQLPPGCQPRLESQWVWHLCWSGSVSYSLQLPPSDLLSLHFRKQLFFHKLQSLGWQPTWQWQIAWGCSGTFPFIFAQSQHSLPGTTSVTRATTEPLAASPASWSVPPAAAALQWGLQWEWGRCSQGLQPANVLALSKLQDASFS